MKQVQLKIEEFFDGYIRYEFNSKSDIALRNNIEKKIVSFININWTLKPNESRETIIQSLWKYQKYLLNIGDNCLGYNDNGFGIWDLNNNIIEFYNPETRIITVTSFDD